jgi:predicted PurR-regulated permease PerM
MTPAPPSTSSGRGFDTPGTQDAGVITELTLPTSARGSIVSNQPGDQPEPFYPAEWTLFARRTAAIGLLAALFYLLTLVTPILEITLPAFIIAFILIYPVLILSSRTRLSYTWAVVLVFLLYLLVVGSVVARLAAPMTNFLINLFLNLQIILNDFLLFLQNYSPDQGWMAYGSGGKYLINLNFILEPLSRWVRGEDLAQLTEIVSNVVGLVTTTLSTLGNVVISGLMAHILAFVFLLEMPAAYNFIFKLTPPEYRREHALLLARVGRRWGAFLRGALISAILTGFLTWFQLAVMGIPNALLISLLTGASSVVPILGTIVGTIPLVVVPLVQGSTSLNVDRLTLMILVVVIYNVLQGILWNTVIPKIYGDAVSLPVSLVILGIILGASTGGVLGAFLAVPMMAILREIVEYLLKKIRGGDPYPGEPEPTFFKGRVSLAPGPAAPLTTSKELRK